MFDGDGLLIPNGLSLSEFAQSVSIHTRTQACDPIGVLTKVPSGPAQSLGIRRETTLPFGQETVFKWRTNMPDARHADPVRSDQKPVPVSCPKRQESRGDERARFPSGIHRVLPPCRIPFSWRVPAFPMPQHCGIGPGGKLLEGLVIHSVHVYRLRPWHASRRSL